jgi:isopentenyldiphosphate isomerase
MSENNLDFQAYSEQAEPLGPISKPAAAAGGLHGASHVWIWRDGENGKEILLQKRAADKLSWPDHLDISAAGHLDAGETPLEAAIRETKEELGLRAAPQDLHCFGVHRARLHGMLGDKPFIENEFQWLYLLELPGTMEFTFEDEEVSAVYWVSIEEFRQIIDGKTDERIVRHGSVYFETLIEALQYDETV